MNDSRLPDAVQKGLDRLADDSLNGASFLAACGLRLLAECGRESVRQSPATLRNRLIALARGLCLSQPAIQAIGNRAFRVLDCLFSLCDPLAFGTAAAVETLDNLVLEALDSSERELTGLGEKGAAYLSQRISPDARIVTLSASRTVFEVLRRLKNLDLTVSVAESRPLNEGLEFASSLAGEGLRVRLVTDAMLGLETPGAALALAGADSILPSGAVQSKAGTRLLALAARADNVPFYCLSQIDKIAPYAGEAVESAVPCQRQRPDSEILASPLAGVQPLNLYFDRTEAPLITGYLTESGPLERGAIENLSRQFADTRRRVLGE